METTIIPAFNALGIILFAASITFVFLAMVIKALTHLASVGWHVIASVGWHG